MPADKRLRTSFDFPEFWTVDQKDKFQRVEIPAYEALKDEQGIISPIKYQAMEFRAAIAAGLFLNWKSEVMPTLDIKVEGDVDADVVEWAGQEVINWLRERQPIPKVSLWRLPMQLIGLLVRRQNWSKAGNSNG